MADVLVVTIGTRGDVVPYAALGRGLVAAGHRVTVATHPSLRGHVDAAGLRFAPLPVEVNDGGATLTSTRLARLLAARWLDVGRAVRDASRGADLLLLAPLGMLGYHVAEAAGIPSMGAFLQPLEPTRAFPPALVTTRGLGGAGNRAASWAFRVLGQVPFARATAAFRRELGLPPLRTVAAFRRMERERWPVLYGFSPAVVPTPPDWPAHRPMTGYWWPDPGDGLSARVRRFLDAGAPPVFVGFGSMAAPHLDGVVAGALARLGRRAVVQQGIAGLSADRDDVLVIGEEPHAELFRRVSVVVHHGGAGTTAAALRAGAPAVCVPFTADQPFWARRVVALGAGAPAVASRRLSADRLADAIVAAETCRAGAEAVAHRLAAEDGVAAAVALIGRVLSPVQ
jgi:sterol 3beta-glucosyltransferase